MSSSSNRLDSPLRSMVLDWLLFCVVGVFSCGRLTIGSISSSPAFSISLFSAADTFPVSALMNEVIPDSIM